jgi:hypothetical protein
MRPLTFCFDKLTSLSTLGWGQWREKLMDVRLLEECRAVMETSMPSNDRDKFDTKWGDTPVMVKVPARRSSPLQRAAVNRADKRKDMACRTYIPTAFTMLAVHCSPKCTQYLVAVEYQMLPNPNFIKK